MNRGGYEQTVRSGWDKLVPAPCPLRELGGKIDGARHAALKCLNIDVLEVDAM